MIMGSGPYESYFYPMTDLSEVEERGFKFNPYNLCVANKQVNGKEKTMRFHVNNLILSYKDKKVNNKSLK